MFDSLASHASSRPAYRRRAEVYGADRDGHRHGLPRLVTVYEAYHILNLVHRHLRHKSPESTDGGVTER